MRVFRYLSIGISLENSINDALQYLHGRTCANSLKKFSWFENYLTELPTLPDSLKILNCGNNLLNELSILPDSLKELVCSYNYLTELPRLPDF